VYPQYGRNRAGCAFRAKNIEPIVLKSGRVVDVLLGTNVLAQLRVNCRSDLCDSEAVSELCVHIPYKTPRSLSQVAVCRRDSTGMMRFFTHHRRTGRTSQPQSFGTDPSCELFPRLRTHSTNIVEGNVCWVSNFSCKSRRVGCAPTAQKCIVFKRFELPLSEKQVPRFIGNVSSC
jgi:hypothetical protein